MRAVLLLLLLEAAWSEFCQHKAVLPIAPVAFAPPIVGFGGVTVAQLPAQGVAALTLTPRVTSAATLNFGDSALFSLLAKKLERGEPLSVLAVGASVTCAHYNKESGTAHDASASAAP